MNVASLAFQRGTLMKLPRRAFLHLAAGAAAFPAVLRIARAQAYPSRPITMIVPFAPGGISDVMGRMMAEPLRAILVRLLTTGDKGRWGVWRAVGFGDPAGPPNAVQRARLFNLGPGADGQRSGQVYGSRPAYWNAGTPRGPRSAKTGCEQSQHGSPIIRSPHPHGQAPSLASRGRAPSRS
jgi:hypothetical protein